jgi:two-component system phosphate regulon response regulator PhoB
MTRAHILVVDDEPDILELVQYNLSKANYEVTCVDSGEAALSLVQGLLPDLVLLDLMLPGMDGLEFCQRLKRNPRTATIPLLMLTARGEEADVVAGLELGADDYVAKPFSPRVLLARIKALLRRRQSEPAPTSTVIIQRDLVIHPGRHEVLAQGQPVQLTPTEFRILHLLARRPGWVFTRNQILEAAQGDESSVTARAVDVHIVALRRKLGGCGEAIETIRGVGYRLQE